MHPIELPNGRKIGPGQPAFLAAEIGQNHNGDAYTALRLAKAAHDAGCDAIKLCKRHIPSDLAIEARNAPYDTPHAYGATYGLHREALELSIGEYVHLADRIRYNGWPQILFATVCDLHSLLELESELDPPLYKIASRDLDNLPLLEAVARTTTPIILSTGMARDDREIETAVATIMGVRNWPPLNVIVCYCTSEYPTPDEHVALRRIDDLRRRFDGIAMVGFSDHTVGIHLAQAAVQCGAVYVEKHVTLARAQPGTDHAASLEPEGLRKLVRNIRGVEDALRREYPPPGLDTERARRKLGRSLIATCDIRIGTIISAEMLTLKSPGDGIPYAERDRVIGRRARVPIPEDATLQFADLTD